MVEELWIFKENAELAASDWCHVSLGTPSIYLTNLGATWDIPNLSLTSMAHCQPLWDVFRWKLNIGRLGLWKDNIWTKSSAARITIHQAHMSSRRLNASAPQRDLTLSGYILSVLNTPCYNLCVAHTAPNPGKERNRSQRGSWCTGPTRQPLLSFSFLSSSSLLLLRQWREAN